MRVQIIYKNKSLEEIDTIQYDLDIYCLNLAERLIKVLSEIESLFDIDTLKTNPSYQKLRHTLLDVSGEIRRMPSNLMLEPGQKIVWEDDKIEEDTSNNLDTQNISDNNISEETIAEQKPPKLTLSLIKRFFGGGIE